MRTRTLLTTSLILLSLGALVVVGLALDSGPGSDLSIQWVSDTGRSVGGNHHAPAAGIVAGDPMVFAPISGRAGSNDCGLVGLHGSNGSERWTNPISADNCTIHAVADPVLADYDGDGVQEVLAATTEDTVTAHNPYTGAVEFEANLSSYGYTRPIVTDLMEDGRMEIITVDARGSIFVFGDDGDRRWSNQFGSYTWSQPAVADFTDDGRNEVAISLGGAGEIFLLDSEGDSVWAESTTVRGSITWMATGPLEDGTTDIVVATTAGDVVAIEGMTGERMWTRNLGSFAAVSAVGDGDSDGRAEVYAVGRNGTLWSLEASTGDSKWSSALTTADVQMTPPPALGDLDGDGTPELLAVTNDGIVSVVAPKSGEVLASHERDASIFASPTLADIDGDGSLEGFIMYGDARVYAFDVS